MFRLRHYYAVCRDPEHLRRTLTIALVVGTWLTLYNQLMAGVPAMDAGTALAVFLNFLTPFVVANWGLVSRQAPGPT